ncbi:hypothetical protein FGO68_gene4575 [Halteria grandinella]|uniref:Uncharacterized protein n=1 Tax=Halteria grandinella TaxID=5974 RepID=A0A8J8NTK8_HALGN|nr:hypothetical protein FGO68_gene4575 [Halteria grandinella]
MQSASLLDTINVYKQDQPNIKEIAKLQAQRMKLLKYQQGQLLLSNLLKPERSQPQGTPCFKNQPINDEISVVEQSSCIIRESVLANKDIIEGLREVMSQLQTESEDLKQDSQRMIKEEKWPRL